MGGCLCGRDAVLCDMLGCTYTGLYTYCSNVRWASSRCLPANDSLCRAGMMPPASCTGPQTMPSSVMPAIMHGCAVHIQRPLLASWRRCAGLLLLSCIHACILDVSSQPAWLA